MKKLDEAMTIKRDLAMVRDELVSLTHRDDPICVLEQAEEKMLTLDPNGHEMTNDEPIFKAMTLREFDNGTLLSMAMSKPYKTLGIDLMRKLQTEYKCESPSEKATAELASISFMRILDTQRRITNYLDIGSFSDIGVQYVAVLSKELDRASRHYLAALQTLRMLKQPPMSVNVKANIANVANQQVVKNENVIEAK